MSDERAMNGSLQYSIATGEESLEAVLRMISGGRFGAAAREAMEVFLRFAARYGIDVSRQAVARLDSRMVGYCLCLVNPGATASVFLPDSYPELDRRYSFREVAADVLRTLAGRIDEWDLAIMQAMTEDETSVPARIFLQAGFGVLCRLEIMQAEVDRRDPSAKEAAEATWTRFEPSQADSFAAIILQSYEGSQDCPALTGLRTGEEVVAGHQSSGIFEPEGWWVLRYRDRDAGVILLNGTEEDPHRLELVYMGLAPWARGSGLGSLLLDHGFHVARTLGKKVVRLSVDCTNGPAIRLYRKFGFRPAGHQTVLAVLNEKRRAKIARHEGTNT